MVLIFVITETIDLGLWVTKKLVGGIYYLATYSSEQSQQSEQTTQPTNDTSQEAIKEELEISKKCVTQLMTDMEVLKREVIDLKKKLKKPSE